MASWLVALIAAAGAVAGAAVSGVIAYYVARLDREARDTDELRAALGAYGAALDRLSLRIDQLPQSHGVKEGSMTKFVAKWPAIDWLIGRISVATIGRSAMIAIDEVIAATNRLSLVAPGSVLEAMERLSQLIGRFDPAAATWKDEWKDARAVFSGTARTAVEGRSRQAFP
jgi:hypothetical protein